jgi:hypothetical protein
VVLASGATVAISQLWAGAQVLAANPQTGKTQAETVDKVWVNHDTDLMDIVVNTAQGQGTIDSTAHHLFWDLTTRAWTEADQLKVGDRLWTPDGQLATVARLVSVPGAEDMWDLTVANDHDFYVVSVDTAVLVHNCPVEPYQVGPYNELQDQSEVGDGLDLHHVPQGNPASQVIPGYDYSTAPSIALPQAEHLLVPNVSGLYGGSAEDLISGDLANLQTYTNAPQSSLDQLSQLIQEMYGGG